MTIDDNTPIAELKNLGEKSATQLNQIGIYSYADLRNYGVVNAFVTMQQQCHPKPSLNFLYAMEGAMQDCHWHKIVSTDKLRLLTELDTHNDLFQLSQE